MEAHIACTISGISPQKLNQILALSFSFEDLIGKQRSFYRLFDLSDTIVRNLQNPCQATIRKILRWAQQAHAHIIETHSPGYPESLKQLPCHPSLLYVLGDVNALSNASVAVVGSRNASYYGLETTKKLSAGLAQAGWNIVSGLALGIDAKAHEACLEQKQPTIAVIGLGLDQVTPTCHLKLAQKIQQNGCLISEMPPGTNYSPHCFPRRNRLIAALARAILIPEAARKSGTLITAQYAIDLHRPVLAVPGRINQPQAAGCHQLIQDGAHLVTNTQDCLHILSYLAEPITLLQPTKEH